MTDQLFLRKEVLRMCAGMGSTGMKFDTLLTELRREIFHELTDDELREQLHYLGAEHFISVKRAVLDPSALRYVVTPEGEEAISQ
jgi:hypothetical protein